MSADPNVLTCPECGEPMHRDRRILVHGRTPFRCVNRHLAIDEAEPVQSAKATTPINDVRERARRNMADHADTLEALGDG